MKSFTLKRTGPICGDETAPYDVVFLEKMTVREFVDYVLTLNEWGSIALCLPGFSANDMQPCCQYSHDKLESELPEEYMDRTIASATAHGGWSLMDYILTLI